MDDPHREATSRPSERDGNDDAVLALASACATTGLLVLLCIGVAATIGFALKIGGVI